MRVHGSIENGSSNFVVMGWVLSPNLCDISLTNSFRCPPVRVFFLRTSFWAVTPPVGSGWDGGRFASAGVSDTLDIRRDSVWADSSRSFHALIFRSSRALRTVIARDTIRERFGSFYGIDIKKRAGFAVVGPLPSLDLWAIIGREPKIQHAWQRFPIGNYSKSKWASADAIWRPSTGNRQSGSKRCTPGKTHSRTKANRDSLFTMTRDGYMLISSSEQTLSCGGYGNRDQPEIFFYDDMLTAGASKSRRPHRPNAFVAYAKLYSVPWLGSFWADIGFYKTRSVCMPRRREISGNAEGVETFSTPAVSRLCRQPPLKQR